MSDRRIANRQHRRRRAAASRGRRSFHELLEDRRMLAVFTVLIDSDAPVSGLGDAPGTLRQAIFDANDSAGADVINFDSALNGAAIDLSEGELLITDDLMIDASSLSGGLTIDAGDGTDNTPGTGDGSRVFSVYNSTYTGNIDAELRGLTITGGDTFYAGGGVYSGENLTITDSVITGNTFLGDSGFGGGGVYAGGYGTLTIQGSTISGNSSDYFGGGVAAGSYANVSIISSTISGNSTGGSGGGIAVLYNGTGTPLTILHSTITQNTADAGASDFGDGGGIFFSGNGTADIRHTIVAGNVDSSPTATNVQPDMALDSASLDAMFSLIGDNRGSTLQEPAIAGTPDAAGNLVGGPNNGVIDPLLGPLGLNGGPTMTHELLAGSPAIDAGDPGFLPPPDFDQRGAGFDRVTGGRIDIGALEIGSGEAPSLVVTTATDVVAIDGLTSLREAVAFANINPGEDTVTFDAGVFNVPQTIALALGEIEITEAMTLDGPGQDLLTIDAQQNSRVLYITAFTGDFTIEGVTITGGFITSLGDVPGGAGIRSRTAGLLTVDQSTITGNRAEADEISGGGIDADGALLISSSTISGNSAIAVLGSLGYQNSYGGGVVAFGDITVLNSTISGNRAEGDRGGEGGGIFAAANLTLINSTVSGNSTSASDGFTSDGGGLLVSRDLMLTQSTVTGNRSYGQSARGSGIFARAPYGSAVTITSSSIIAGNMLIGGASDLQLDGRTLAASFSIFGDTSDLTAQQMTDLAAGPGNSINTDPRLGPLADNGGETLTHELLAGSPAVDAGDPTFDPNNFVPPLINDQRGVGFDRVRSGRIDVGALESAAEAPSLIVTTELDIADSLDGVTSLREAVAFANSLPGSDTVTFDPGLFGTAQTIHLDPLLGEIAITDAVTINGPGSSLLTVDASDSDTTQGNGIRIFNIDSVPNNFNVAISGMTLTGGDVTGDGGAIRSVEGLRLVDTVITGNFATGRGGGAYINSPGIGVDMTIDSSVFSSNESGADGGGLLFRAAIDTGQIIDSSFVNNLAVGSGGGIFADGPVAIQRATITGNRVDGSNVTGGGIHSSGESLISYSTIGNNSAGGNEPFSVTYGGGFFTGGDTTISNSTVSGNQALGESEAQGGGIFSLTGANISLVNSTISGNSTVTPSGVSSDGGGIFAQGDLTLNHATVTNNRSYGQGAAGGGIFAYGITLNFANSIIADNTLGGTFGLQADNSSITAAFTLFGDTTALTAIQLASVNAGQGNLLDVDARLDPLADNNGLTMTHAPLADSPAINAGDPGFTSPPSFDQRGVGFDRVQGGRIDIGALETSFLPLSLGDRVWLDLDNDGLFGSGESGIDGVLVNLFRDTDGDGEFVAGVDEFLASDTTTSGGFYRFDGLSPGEYLVQVDRNNFLASQPLAGLVSSTGNNVAGRAPDPDDNVNDDDNGDPIAGQGVVSRAITLSQGDEPINDGDTDANSNLSSDFGFAGVDLAVSLIDANDPIQSGDALTYVLTVSNNGTVDATNVVVTNVLPGAGVTFVSATPMESSMNGNQLTFNLGDLAGGASTAITIELEVASDFVGTLINSLTVTAAETEVNLADNDSSETTEVLPPPSLSLGDRVWLDLDNDGLLGAGELGIDDVLVNLLLDRDLDGEFTAGVDQLLATDTTEQGGRYRFAGLAPGEYLVQIDPVNFLAGGPLEGLVSSTGDNVAGRAPDPDDDVDNDDNGDPIAGFGVVSRTVTLAVGTEPITDGDSNANTNLSVDFGFFALDAPPSTIVHSLTNAPADGSVRVTVDGFGAFGSAVGQGTTDASFDPIGVRTTDGTTFESGLAIRVGLSGERTFLTSGSIGSSSGGDITTAIAGTATTAQSGFTFGDLSFEVSQELTIASADGDRFGSRLTQTYVITNTSSTGQAFELIRYLDGDLFGSLGNDGGGRLISNGVEILFETDEATNAPEADATFVGITVQGGEIDPASHFSVLSFSTLRSNVIAGLGLDNTVQGDDPLDADMTIDPGNGFDVTLALRRTFNLAAAASVSFVTETIFGSGTVTDDVPPIVDLNGAEAGINTVAIINANTGTISITSDALAVSDVDSPLIQSAVVTIRRQPPGANGVLAADAGTTGMIVEFDAARGTLTLAGDGTPQQYASVLRTLTYQSQALTADAGSIELELRVFASGQASLPATATITFEEREIPPVEPPIIEPRPMITVEIDPDASPTGLPGSTPTLARISFVQPTGSEFDEGSSGGVFQPPTVRSPNRLVAAGGRLARQLLAISGGSSREEITDALFYLIDNEQIMLLAIDMGDEPIAPQQDQPQEKPPKKEVEPTTGRKVVFPQPALAADLPDEHPLRGIVLGSLATLMMMIGGQWLWRRKRKRAAN